MNISIPLDIIFDKCYGVKMDTETRDKMIVELYEHRKSLRAVAKVFNISHEKVREILKRYNVVRLSTGRPKKRVLEI